MRRVIGVVASSVAVVVSLSAVPAHAAVPASMALPAAAPDSASAAADFAWVNAQRAAAGVAPLQMQPWAQNVAQAHSVDMANAGSIFHNMTGYMGAGHGAMGATYLGENVAMGTNLDYAQTALINSPPHKANILDPRFNYVGVAAATDASGQVYVTEDFAQIGAGAQPQAAPVAPKPVPVPAPRPVVVAPPAAPKPVVVATAKPVAVAAPQPAPTVAAPKPAAASPTPTAAPAKPAAAALVAQTKPSNTTALVLYVVLGILGAAFSLGLGYKLTRLLPGR